MHYPKYTTNRGSWYVSATVKEVGPAQELITWKLITTTSVLLPFSNIHSPAGRSQVSNSESQVSIGFRMLLYYQDFKSEYSALWFFKLKPLLCTWARLGTPKLVCYYIAGNPTEDEMFFAVGLRQCGCIAQHQSTPAPPSKRTRSLWGSRARVSQHLQRQRSISATTAGSKGFQNSQTLLITPATGTKSYRSDREIGTTGEKN